MKRTIADSDKAISAAVGALNGSERGRRALKDFKAMMVNGAELLDSTNSEALMTITWEAMQGRRDFIRNL